VWLPRTGKAAEILGKLTGKGAYPIEQMTAVPGTVRWMRKIRPHVVLSSDIAIAKRLGKLRGKVLPDFALMYSNGAPLKGPFGDFDHVQQVVPYYLDEGIADGEPAEKQTVVPYGIRVPEGDPDVSVENKMAARKELSLPLDRPIVISVGWISKSLKRMDYTVSEVARLPEPRPFLVMLGAMDDTTPPILKQADEQLGKENYLAKSVAYQQVARYYAAADVFVLGSLQEGFGRVYLESLIAGLPTLAHRHPVMQYVLDDVGVLGDFSAPGGMAGLIQQALQAGNSPADAARRRNSVRKRFAWESLRLAYKNMFLKAHAQRTARKN
jgi:glycosyltransferase involved in cell wall biosynthesis